MFPKEQAFRSESYRRYVAGFPCFACGIHGYSQAAHPNTGKGMRIKPSDLLCFPLCSTRPGHMGCHKMHDELIDMTRDERRDLEARYSVRMQLQAMMDGRKEFKEAA